MNLMPYVLSISRIVRNAPFVRTTQELMMTRYRKKPVEVEVWQFNDTFQTAPQWVIDAVKDGTIHVVPDMYPSKEEDRTVHLFIKTLEGEMCAEPHDYIIQGVKGELYPCKPDIFEATYEVVS